MVEQRRQCMSTDVSAEAQHIAAKQTRSAMRVSEVCFLLLQLQCHVDIRVKSVPHCLHCELLQSAKPPVWTDNVEHEEPCMDRHCNEQKTTQHTCNNNTEESANHDVNNTNNNKTTTTQKTTHKDRCRNKGMGSMEKRSTR